MPFHSIIVPTYNQDKYIGAALDSILAQSDPDWEAIVVNDGSTDSTRSIIEGYAQRDSRIKCFSQENGGVASALNKALEHATGDWIHWLSSDDLFEPAKLSLNRRWIASHQQSNFFFSYFTLLRESTGAMERRELWGPIPSEDQQTLTLLYRNYISGISICVRRSAWEEVGFFDRDLRYGQDYDQWLRILQRHKATFIPEWTVINRNHAEQGSETFPEACYFDTAKAAIRFLNRHPFQEFSPVANLDDEDAALRTVIHALDVARDRTSFVYALGVHPGLAMRILEWVFSDLCPWETVREHAEKSVREMSFQADDSNWSWMWKQLAISLCGPNRRFVYEQVSPTAVGIGEWSERSRRKTANIQSAAEYLQRFDGVTVGANTRERFERSRIVLLAKGSLVENDPLLAVACALADVGLRPILLFKGQGEGQPNLSLIENVPVIHLHAFDKDTLPWIGDVDLAVYGVGIERSPWLGSLSAIDLQPGMDMPSVKAAVLNAITAGDVASTRKVVFVERVLAGGGAERVVLNVSRHLDRKRYQPEIWTLFEEHGTLPDLGDITHVPLANTAIPPHSTPLYQNMRSALNLGQVVYHFLLSEETRRQLEVGARLRRFARSILKRQKPSRAPSQPEDVAIENHASERDFNFCAAIDHHEPQALAISREVKHLRPNSTLLTVMEEATVAAWFAQASQRFNFVASLHTLESRCMSDLFREPARNRAERWLFKSGCEGAGKVIMPSAGCRQDLIREFCVQGSKVDVVPNPVDCARVRRLSFQYSREAAEWVGKSRGLRLVHVGRLDPQKDHDLLLESCWELKLAGLDFSLALVGDGWARPSVEQKIRDLDLGEHVTLAGAQDNPFPWMAAADALTLTSRFEAFGLVLVEAMICGTAVISVDCPEGPREVLSGGDFGVLVEERTPKAFANAITTLMDSPAQIHQLREKGYERALDFDVKKVVPLWEQLIEAQIL